MTGPPPLSLHLGSGVRERAVSAVVWMLAGLVMGLWMQGRGGLGVDGLGAMLGALLGAAAGAVVARPMQGLLIWDGQHWSLRTLGAAQAHALDGLSLAIDLGAVVVVRARPAQWAMLTRRQAGDQWHGLQMALRFGQGPTGQEAAP